MSKPKKTNKKKDLIDCIIDMDPDRLDAIQDGEIEDDVEEED